LIWLNIFLYFYTPKGPRISGIIRLWLCVMFLHMSYIIKCISSHLMASGYFQRTSVVLLHWTCHLLFNVRTFSFGVSYILYYFIWHSSTFLKSITSNILIANENKNTLNVGKVFPGEFPNSLLRWPFYMTNHFRRGIFILGVAFTCWSQNISFIFILSGCYSLPEWPLAGIYIAPSIIWWNLLILVFW
jgi:hypothetical protein